VPQLGNLKAINNHINREYISRDAEGSGVPEMKAVLAGVHLHNFLSFKAFIGKWTGIVVGLLGGLSFGR
jgi:H+/Cl- antiporter ClcA